MIGIKTASLVVGETPRRSTSSLDASVGAGIGGLIIGAILIALGLYDLATKQAVLRSELVAGIDNHVYFGL